MDNPIEQAGIQHVLSEGWPEEWVMNGVLTDEDLLDIAMLWGGSVTWTGTRVIEIIDFRNEAEAWHERKEWD